MRNFYLDGASTIIVLFLVLTLFLMGCEPMRLERLSPARGASGEIFTIHGRNFGSSTGSKIASINRCRAYRLEVLSWSPEEIRARIPSGLPSGNFKVLIYYDSTYRTSSNSLDFWVTASPLPSSITDPYETQVRSFRIKYGKSVEWENWMIRNRDRYENAFERIVLRAPCTIRIAFRYDTNPIAYNPPWANEAQHMEALATMAELTYPGYDFRFIFLGDIVSSFANVIAGIPTNNSRASGKNVYLYYETIFCHEFAYVMGLRHHYDTPEEIGRGRHMPPGERECLMDRNSEQFCSACRTALNIPLDVDNAEAIESALHEIGRRYPY